ncbi:hypothetical protein SAMN04487896_0234 [Paenibacillus sp. ov031]|nr:hypothetical protein SAMN04487896_0234 [Paenibacillus sp. ov031]
MLILGTFCEFGTQFAPNISMGAEGHYCDFLVGLNMSSNTSAAALSTDLKICPYISSILVFVWPTRLAMASE